MKKLKTLIIACVAVVGAVFFVGQCRAQLGIDNYNVLYGLEGNPPVKGVVTRFVWAGNGLSRNGDEINIIRERFSKLTYEIVQNIFTKEYGISVREESGPTVDDIALNIFLIIKDATALTPPAPYYVAAIYPAFGRSGTKLSYPYYDYELPKVFIVPADKDALMKEYEAQLRPIIESERRRIVCSQVKNRDLSLCQVPRDLKGSP